MTREDYLSTGPDGTQYPECERCDAKHHTPATHNCAECHADICEEHLGRSKDRKPLCLECYGEKAVECAA